jgi:hypothetical protein
MINGPLTVLRCDDLPKKVPGHGSEKRHVPAVRGERSTKDMVAEDH